MKRISICILLLSTLCSAASLTNLEKNFEPRRPELEAAFAVASKLTPRLVEPSEAKPIDAMECETVETEITSNYGNTAGVFIESVFDNFGLGLRARSINFSGSCYGAADSIVIGLGDAVTNLGLKASRVIRKQKNFADGTKSITVALLDESMRVIEVTRTRTEPDGRERQFEVDSVGPENQVYRREKSNVGPIVGSANMQNGPFEIVTYISADGMIPRASRLTQTTDGKKFVSDYFTLADVKDWVSFQTPLTLTPSTALYSYPAPVVFVSRAPLSFPFYYRFLSSHSIDGNKQCARGFQRSLFATDWTGNFTDCPIPEFSPYFSGRK